MNDQPRDRELNWMRAQWQSIQTPLAAQATAVRAYHQRFGAVRTRRFWMPVAAAALAASAALVLLRVHPMQAAYRPVEQPRILDLSQGDLHQGERP